MRQKLRSNILLLVLDNMNLSLNVSGSVLVKGVKASHCVRQIAPDRLKKSDWERSELNDVLLYMTLLRRYLFLSTPSGWLTIVSLQTGAKLGAG